MKKRSVESGVANGKKKTKLIRNASENGFLVRDFFYY